jgi:hypothetical protein
LVSVKNEKKIGPVQTVNNESNDVLNSETHEPRDQLAIRKQSVIF